MTTESSESVIKNLDAEDEKVPYSFDELLGVHGGVVVLALAAQGRACPWRSAGAGRADSVAR